MRRGVEVHHQRTTAEVQELSPGGPVTEVLCKAVGMTLDFTTPGQVKVSMFAYVDEMLAAYKQVAPKKLGTKTSATPKDLSTVEKDCEKLGRSQSEQFLHLVAKTLFATKRPMPNTGTAISFLTS
jgi:hypothetical protein